MFSMLGYCQIRTLMTPKIVPGGAPGLIGACWLGGAGASGVLALGVLSCAVLCWVCGCVWCLLPLRLLLRCRVLCLRLLHFLCLLWLGCRCGMPPFCVCVCLSFLVVPAVLCLSLLSCVEVCLPCFLPFLDGLWCPSLSSKVSVTGYALRYLPKHCAPHLHLTSSQHFCLRKFTICPFNHWSATANVPVKVMTADEQEAPVNTLETTLEAILRFDIQAALAELEVNTCEVFALIESATERLKEWPHANLRVAAAWEAVVAQWQQDNEQRAAGLSALTPSSAIVSTRRGWGRLSWNGGPPKSTTASSQQRPSQKSSVRKKKAPTWTKARKPTASELDARQFSVSVECKDACASQQSSCVQSAGYLRSLPNTRCAKDCTPSFFPHHVDWILGDEAAEPKTESERGQETLGAASWKCDKKPPKESTGTELHLLTNYGWEGKAINCHRASW